MYIVTLYMQAKPSQPDASFHVRDYIRVLTTIDTINSVNLQ